MSTIKIKTAYHYRTLGVVFVGGETTGAFELGDQLYNVDDPSETYYVKGVALMSLKNKSRGSADIQLKEGDYNAQELIGKTLKTIE